MRVTFYNVGQALSALVQLPDGRHILVDTGDAPKRSECGDACQQAHDHLLDRLHADLEGASIDLLWITHQHSDHLGGAFDLLRQFTVTAYVDNGRDLDKVEVLRARRAASAQGAEIHVVDCDRHDIPFTSEGMVHVTAMVPRAFPPSCAHDANDCSIGLRVDYCSSSVLFVGDASQKEEAVLEVRPATLLQVAHHGSDTSSSTEFLRKCAPKYAVISAGKPGEGMNADYCHPRASTVKRLNYALGGAPLMTLPSFAGSAKCKGAGNDQWVDAPSSDRLWATERDGDVVLSTRGDGIFTRE
ncbi:MAG: hypothetical protein NVS3B20_01720 [Polyangiales bacterium]